MRAGMLAHEAANRAELPIHIRQHIVYHTDLVMRIQLRLVDIIANLPLEVSSGTLMSKTLRVEDQTYNHL